MELSDKGKQSLDPGQTVELHIPSTLGSEKEAMGRAAEVTRSMGFSEDRVSDLKTAVAEACTNAIEHGNEFDESAKVRIVLTIDKGSLQVSVHDEGKDIGGVPTPDVEKKIAGQESKRGWGKFLIQNLTDDSSFDTSQEGGNMVTMVIYLDK